MAVTPSVWSVQEVETIICPSCYKIIDQDQIALYRACMGDNWSLPPKCVACFQKPVTQFTVTTSVTQINVSPPKQFVTCKISALAPIAMSSKLSGKYWDMLVTHAQIVVPELSNIWSDTVKKWPWNNVNHQLEVEFTCYFTWGPWAQSDKIVKDKIQIVKTYLRDYLPDLDFECQPVAVVPGSMTPHNHG